MKSRKVKITQNSAKSLGLGAALLVGAVAVAVGGAIWLRDGRTFDRVMVFVAAGAMAAMGLLLLFSVLVSKSYDRKGETLQVDSYFLYDFKARKTMEPSELTIKSVYDHIATMLLMQGKHPEQVFLEETVFEDSDKPLLFLFLLDYWIVNDDEQMWLEAVRWGKDFADLFSLYYPSVAQDEEQRILALEEARQLQYLIANADRDDMTGVREFIMIRKGRIEQGMLTYVQAHLADLKWEIY